MGDQKTPEEESEKLPDFEDPDMLQLDANVDEDMDLNKAEEAKDESKAQKEEEDEKKEERKRRWKSDDKESSPKRRHSIKKTDERIREPSPPPGEPMHVVHITNLVRPFTLGQLKDFLQVHGDYSDFWIDKIKSNCFVKYNEIESAINCRKLILGKKWPSSNPKSLRVMYSTDEHLEKVKSGSVLPVPNPPSSNQNRDTIRREKKRSASRSPLRGGMRSEKEFDKDRPKEESSAESDDDEGEETGAILLDDLFKKTKTPPSIYWLPLTDEEIKQRDEAREERKRLREERRKASEERRGKEKDSRKRSRSKSRSRSKKRSRSRS